MNTVSRNFLQKNDHLNKPINDMSERDWRIFREDNDIQIKGSSSSTGVMGCPKPLRKWNEV